MTELEEKVKKTLLILLVLALVITQCGYAGNELFRDKPTWVEGCLCLSGKEPRPEGNRQWHDWKVWFLDFDHETISETEIPMNALLIKDLQEGGLPTIVFPDECGGLDLWYQYRSMQYAMLDMDPSSATYRNFLDGYPDPMNAWSGCGAIQSEALFQFLALKMPEQFMYLLEYGVNAEGELCIQLKKRTLANDYVVQEFPTEGYSFRAWYYDVSKNGKVAWSYNNKTIYIGDENGVEALPETERPALGLAWLNENQLIYFQNEFEIITEGTTLVGIDYNSRLSIWDTESGKRKEVVDQAGKPVSLYGWVDAIAVHENEKQIACIYRDIHNLSTKPYKIAIISLENGEIWMLDPYAKELNAEGASANCYFNLPKLTGYFLPEYYNAKIVWE